MSLWLRICIGLLVVALLPSLIILVATVLLASKLGGVIYGEE